MKKCFTNRRSGDRLLHWSVFIYEKTESFYQLHEGYCDSDGRADAYELERPFKSNIPLSDTDGSAHLHADQRHELRFVESEKRIPQRKELLYPASDLAQDPSYGGASLLPLYHRDCYY